MFLSLNFDFRHLTNLKFLVFEVNPNTENLSGKIKRVITNLKLSINGLENLKIKFSPKAIQK